MGGDRGEPRRARRAVLVRLLDPLLSGSPDACAGTRRACDARGIEITSAFTGLIGFSQNSVAHPSDGVRARARDWFETAIDATVALGASGLGGHIAAMSVRQHTDPAARARAIDNTIDAIRALADRAAERRLGYLLWEIMPVAREYPATIAETDELLERLAGTAVPVELGALRGQEKLD